MDKLLKYKSYKSIITVFHNERENIKPRKQGVRNNLLVYQEPEGYSLLLALRDHQTQAQLCPLFYPEDKPECPH
jgi:hypothetical protein